MPPNESAIPPALQSCLSHVVSLLVGGWPQSEAGKNTPPYIKPKNFQISATFFRGPENNRGTGTKCGKKREEGQTPIFGVCPLALSSVSVPLRFVLEKCGRKKDNDYDGRFAIGPFGCWLSKIRTA